MHALYSAFYRHSSADFTPLLRRYNYWTPHQGKTATPGFQNLLPLAVNQAFPMNWVWWVTLIVCNAVLSMTAEVVNYFLIDMREIQLVSMH